MPYEYEFKQPDGTYKKQTVDTDLSNTAGFLNKNIRLPQGSDTSSNLRYNTLSGSDNKSAYDTQALSYYEGLNRKAPDEKKIYEDSLAMYQSEIDAINNLYNSLVSTEMVAGQDRMGQTRAISSAVGLAGTPRGQAQLDKTERANAQVIENIRREQASKISQVLSKARDRADKKIQAETELARKNAKDYLDFLKSQRDEARADVISLAKGGIPISQLSDEEYKSLLESTGYDPLLFESIYNQNMPNNSVKYEYKQFGDTVVRVGSDGTFMEIGNYPKLADKEIKQLQDGTLVVFDPNDGTYVDYGRYMKKEVEGSAGSGYYYVDYDANGNPTIKWLTRGTDKSGSSNKIIDYLEAIERINAMPTISDENAKLPMSQEGMTQEAKKAAIRNIKAQAADDLNSKDYDKFIKISSGNEIDRTYGYKTIINEATGEAGIWDVDAGRFLTPQEQENYINLKRQQSITF